MPEIELEPITKKITVRLRLSVEETMTIRNEIKKEYTNIPKLNKETFESFGRWVFEDVDEALVQSLNDFFELNDGQAPNINDDKQPHIDDDPSEFEPW